MKEATILQDLLFSSVKELNNMAIFVRRAQDPELRALIERQLPVHLSHYAEKRRLLRGDASGAPWPRRPETLDGRPGGPAPAASLAPDLDLEEIDDRTIALSYFLTLRRAGREYAWAAFDAASPELRAFLEAAFADCSRQAFELQQWLARRGYHPEPEAPEGYLRALEGQYRAAPSRV